MNRIAIIALAVFLAGCTQTPQEKTQSAFNDGLRQLDKGRIAQADSTFKRLRTESPSSPLGLFGAGLVLERQGQTVDALGTYLQVNKLERTFAPALMGMGRVFRRMGEFDLAAAAYQDCSNLPDSMSQAIIGYAVAQCDNGWPQAALAAIKVADSIGADDELTGLLRARILVLQGKRDTADLLFQKVFASADRTPSTLTLAADYLESRGLIDSAIALSTLATEKRGAGYDQLVEHFQRCLRHRYFWDARRTIDRVAADTASLARLGLQIPYHLAQGDNFHANKCADQFMRRGDNSIMSYIYETDVRMPVGDIQTIASNSSAIPNMALH
ncbi:MAG: tetratricopeptide repeat protein, partial [candidate division Zixibacteria bacterium]|nr:tetratricopeptide repeat protein [candidate division Zixibacteria bacterium]